MRASGRSAASPPLARTQPIKTGNLPRSLEGRCHQRRISFPIATVAPAPTRTQPRAPIACLHPEAVNLRLVNRVFSRAAITDVCHGRFDGQAADALRELADDGAISGDVMRSAAIAGLSDWLSRNYRSEYVYKSAVANNLLFGKHSPRTTALLQEFRVGRSKIDCVVVNGSVQAFEIKTRLDSPQKLAKQLADYRTVFPQISVITDEKVAHLYDDHLRDTAVGIVVLTRNGRNTRLTTRKPVEQDTSDLSVEAMMRSLRKPEYTELVQLVTGDVPDVPNTLFFTACLDAVSHMPVGSLYEMWAHLLRKRKLIAPAKVSAESMRPLRHLCAEINPDEKGAANLEDWLSGAVA